MFYIPHDPLIHNHRELILKIAAKWVKEYLFLVVDFRIMYVKME